MLLRNNKRRALHGGGGGAGGGRAHPDELLQERGDFSEHVAEAAGDISTQGTAAATQTSDKCKLQI